MKTHYNVYQLFNGQPRWTSTLELTENDIIALRNSRKDGEGRCFLSSQMLDRVKPYNLAKHLVLSSGMLSGHTYLVDISQPYHPYKG